jgi:epoxide hydrolase-like predicted phosphatase
VRTVDSVIFDLGGVLWAEGGLARLAEGYPVEQQAAVVELVLGPYHEDTDHPWHRVERGELDLASFVADLRERARAAGIELRGWGSSGGGGSGEAKVGTTLNDEMVRLVRELRGSGVRTGLLTNNVAELRPTWRAMLPWDELFDDVVDSSEVGLRKPNEAIYRLALARLGAHAERTAFVDDMPSNVHAAERLGMVGVHVEGDGEAAIATVRRLAGLVAPAG